MSAFVNCHKVTVPFASFVFCHREVMLDTWEALFFPPMFLVLTRGAFSSAEAAKQKSIFFKAFSISAAEGTGIGGASFFCHPLLASEKNELFKKLFEKTQHSHTLLCIAVFTKFHLFHILSCFGFIPKLI